MVKAPITKFQAPENLQSLSSKLHVGEAALCLGFGAWDLELPVHFAQRKMVPAPLLPKLRG
jgi:hypothetical protein